ncbi:cysteine desulfurase family protein [Pseudolysinimonas yzui]|uniref:cysteine desulfurase n=1 Tax=Pseudolysinimonas yzui TaxID=2708254 RepID=A0A8J3M2P2_9MICO|nr:cysteine desulfurase family protein [Pseudolysinimonas yzui]GHF26165.1 cysteine desulfurase [Pseudolysinimonas yzui]
MSLNLDHAAASPVSPAVIDAITSYLSSTESANPSSRHEPGERAARALTEARARIAAELGCRPAEIVLTSGGTEADNLAIKGIALADPRGRHLVTSPLEHEAVRESCDYLRHAHGFEIDVLPVDAEGRIDPASLAAAIRPDTTLVSITYASNEVGTVQPIPELAAAARAAGTRMHVDAVQAAPWFDVSPLALGVDAVSIAGHKLGTPTGFGALLVRAGVPLEPLVHGGGQERGRRAGTENLLGAVALAAALAERPRRRLEAAEVSAARDALIDGILRAVPGSILTGSRRHRLPGHASFCFPGTAGEAVLIELGMGGIVCSSGSACAAGSDEPSPALLALGIAPEVAQTAVRFSFGAGFTTEDAERVVAEVAAAVAAVSGMARR